MLTFIVFTVEQGDSVLIEIVIEVKARVEKNFSYYQAHAPFLYLIFIFLHLCIKIIIN